MTNYRFTSIGLLSIWIRFLQDWL